MLVYCYIVYMSTFVFARLQNLRPVSNSDLQQWPMHHCVDHSRVTRAVWEGDVGRGDESTTNSSRLSLVCAWSASSTFEVVASRCRQLHVSTLVAHILGCTQV